MNKKFEIKQTLNGEPDLIPANGLFEWICCDCRLAHHVVLTHQLDTHVLTAYRDDYVTRELRKVGKKKTKKKR